MRSWLIPQYIGIYQAQRIKKSNMRHLGKYMHSADPNYC